MKVGITPSESLGPGGRSARFHQYLDTLPRNNPRRKQIEAAERAYLTARSDRATVIESTYAEQMRGPWQPPFVV